MIIYVDIDETICYYKGERNYNLAVPYTDRIAKINKLFEEGNQIYYWTARGTGSGIDWKEVTKKQLKLWNCKYHSLNFGKPVYDLFIDDKNINSEEYFKHINTSQSPSQ
tara:strand:+ start:36 stop:362 length:327 start_codon:yes stop_codon:yes gene_type:complete